MRASHFIGPEPGSTTLGILAGGRATRLGGLDKAWLVRDGIPQVLRCHRAFESVTCAALVSANRTPERYRRYGLSVVADAGTGDRGPAAGLEALAAACRTVWLLTVPVDLVEFESTVAHRLMGEAGPDGAFVRDAEGVQPLVAVWRVDALRATLRPLAGGAYAVHALHARLAMREVVFAGLRLGNLNRPDDLLAAGIVSSN
jgi:molybdopterin-guanine dinucleotide biosynthesis protein A